jgi:diguanylate cyclase (GGDEF)-like protein
MWWLAHAIFAAGFFLLSYGVVRAFLTTRSFSTIYSHEEMMAQLAEAMARTETALRDLRRTNETLERLAATDPLTGADNRRRFIEHVEFEIRRVKSGGTPFCVLAIDLDNFKAVNDRYGHQVGDDVLKGFVQTCVAAIRPYDGIARVGGEEFMVLLPQAALEVALVVAERLRTAVACASFQSGAQRLSDVTVSIGIAQSGSDGDTIDDILRIADERLYNAKHQGRNRVVSA